MRALDSKQNANAIIQYGVAKQKQFEIELFSEKIEKPVPTVVCTKNFDLLLSKVTKQMNSSTLNWLPKPKNGNWLPQPNNEN